MYIRVSQSSGFIWIPGRGEFQGGKEGRSQRVSKGQHGSPGRLRVLGSEGEGVQRSWARAMDYRINKLADP